MTLTPIYLRTIRSGSSILVRYAPLGAGIWGLVHLRHPICGSNRRPYWWTWVVLVAPQPFLTFVLYNLLNRTQQHPTTLFLTMNQSRKVSYRRGLFDPATLTTQQSIRESLTEFSGVVNESNVIYALDGLLDQSKIVELILSGTSHSIWKILGSVINRVLRPMPRATFAWLDYQAVPVFRESFRSGIPSQVVE